MEGKRGYMVFAVGTAAAPPGVTVANVCVGATPTLVAPGAAAQISGKARAWLLRL